MGSLLSHEQLFPLPSWLAQMLLIVATVDFFANDMERTENCAKEGTEWQPASQYAIHPCPMPPVPERRGTSVAALMETL